MSITEKRRGGRNAASRYRFNIVTVGALLLAAVLLVFLCAPVLWIFWASFNSSSALASGGWSFTLANFEALWRNDFHRLLFNSLYVCLVATSVSTVFAVAAAYVLSRYRFAYKRWLLALLVITQIFPWIVMVTPLFTFFSQAGLVNNHAAVMFCYVAITLPFSIYLLVGYFEALPKDLDEAAFMDGCSRLQVLRHIIFPLIVPGLVATATYSFLLMWTEFLMALTLLTKTGLKTLPLGLALFVGEENVDWGAVMAASALTTLPALLLFLPVQARLVSGLAAGAVKG